MALAFFCVAWCLLAIPTSAFAPPNGPRKARVARADDHHHLLNESRGDSEGEPQRRPWEFLRFVRQSSKFVSPPSLPFAGPTTRRRTVTPGDLLYSPSGRAGDLFGFAPLDDVVMGGASSSDIDNNTGVWSGAVTSANGGGFVGVRSTPFRDGTSLDMSACEGVELRLRRGGGRRFKFVTRDSAEFNGICWTTSFDAANGGVFGRRDDSSQTVVRLPFDGQVPTIFAKTVAGKSFQIDNVVGFQIAYSKFEYDGKLNPNFAEGDFSLQILELTAY